MVQSIFEVVQRMSAEGYTVLIVEQNIQQVLKVARPRLPARDRAHQLERRGGRHCSRAAKSSKAVPGTLTMEIFDIFLLEAVVNGILLGGMLALLVAGPEPDLRRHRRGVDLLRRADHDRHVRGVLPAHAVRLAAVARHGRRASLVVAVLGAALHQFVIRPVLAAEPINQLLVTGGVLFFLQGAATLAFGVEFQNLGVRLPPIEVGEMYLSLSRLIAFVAALAGMVATCTVSDAHLLGTAIRAISQDRAIMPLMGVNPDRIFLVTSALGGALAGLAACLLVLQYDIHPAIGLPSDRSPSWCACWAGWATCSAASSRRSSSPSSSRWAGTSSTSSGATSSPSCSSSL